MSQLNTPQAHTLREAMRNARAAFCMAQVDYLNAMAIAMDIGKDVDAAAALVREGRTYAQALTRYSEATMAWLVFVDTRLHAKKANNTN